VLASDRLLDEEHGERFLVWELRGGRVCIERAGQARRSVHPAGDKSAGPPRGVRYVVTEDGEGGAPYPGLRLRRDAGPYRLWEATAAPPGPGPCPLIAVRQARQAPGP
jgi:hypothetical protein